MKHLQILLPTFLLVIGALGCQEGPRQASVARLKAACNAVDPGGCSQGATERDTVEGAAGLLSSISGLCQGIHTGSATCKKRLEELAGVMGQVEKLAGAWESDRAYGYKAKEPGRVQVATAQTRYWIGARDNKGAIYVSQNNENLLCGSTDMIPAGMSVTAFLDTVPGGVAGETREDQLCEKVYSGFPLCLGTYTSMCVSTGWPEDDHWTMNTRADEACIRSFNWRSSDPAVRERFRTALQQYVTGLAVDPDTCTFRIQPAMQARVELVCGRGETPVFTDMLHRL